MTIQTPSKTRLNNMLWTVAGAVTILLLTMLITGTVKKATDIEKGVKAYEQNKTQQHQIDSIQKCINRQEVINYGVVKDVEYIKVMLDNIYKTVNRTHEQK